VYWFLLVVAALLLFTPTPALAQDNQTCLACHQVEGTKVTFPDGSELNARIDPARFGESVHAQFPCVTCHTRHTGYPHPPRTARTARAYSVEAQAACATCHADRQKEVAGSIHGQGVRMGLGDVPVCTSCHTAHQVTKTKTAAFRNSIPEVCGNCHADERIMRRYGLPPVYQTYQREFHGVTTRLYRLVTPLEPSPAAVCYDCHTAHKVQRAADPASPVHPNNLLGTCRRCHAGAGRFFAAGWTEHKPPSPRSAPLVFTVQVFYWILIPATLLVLVILTGLDLWHFAVQKWGGTPR
jgi:predicted CXXCH cytochrome family protein